MNKFTIDEHNKKMTCTPIYITNFYSRKEENKAAIDSIAYHLSSAHIYVLQKNER